MTTEFKGLFDASARALGYPHLPYVVVPHPFETKTVEEARALADEKFAEMMSKLVAPAREIPAPAR